MLLSADRGNKKTQNVCLAFGVCCCWPGNYSFYSVVWLVGWLVCFGHWLCDKWKMRLGWGKTTIGVRLFLFFHSCSRLSIELW